MKKVFLSIMVLMVSCIIVFVVYNIKFKNSVKFTFDFSAGETSVEIKSVSYQIKNGEGETTFKPAEYVTKNGKLTITNNETIDGGVAFATYVFKVIFTVDGQQVDATYSFIRTNGKKKAKWENTVCTILTIQDNRWNADITSDNYENLHKNKMNNITQEGLEVEIVERFGSLR